jgi:hypothetical protein
MSARPPTVSFNLAEIRVRTDRFLHDLPADGNGHREVSGQV